MFREMRRFKQALPTEECVAVLKEQKRGVLSVLGDDDYPYGIPIDYYYDGKDNALYFHCAKEGHKNDAVAKCDKASFCVVDDGENREGEWFLRFRSVVVFGRAGFVTDETKKKEICSALAKKFGQSDDYAEREWEKLNKRVSCLVLRIEHMTGKRIKEE